jgi:hypothetical protein
LVLILFRSSGYSHFKNDAGKWAEPSVKQSNTITIEQAETSAGKNMVVYLDKVVNPVMGITGDVQKIPADSILGKNHFNTIRKYDGRVLLSSSDPGVSARIWMILSQMGCSNIYILTNETDNEVLKYKFRPDSLSY